MSNTAHEEVLESIIPSLYHGPRRWYNDSGPDWNQWAPNHVPSQWTPAVPNYSTDFNPGGVLWKWVNIEDRMKEGGHWVARRTPNDPWHQCALVHHYAAFKNWLVAVNPASNRYTVLNSIDWTLETRFATHKRTFGVSDTVSFHFTFSTLTLLLNLCVTKKTTRYFKFWI